MDVPFSLARSLAVADRGGILIEFDGIENNRTPPPPPFASFGIITFASDRRRRRRHAVRPSVGPQASGACRGGGGDGCPSSISDFH